MKLIEIDKNFLVYDFTGSGRTVKEALPYIIKDANKWASAGSRFQGKSENLAIFGPRAVGFRIPKIGQPFVFNLYSVSGEHGYPNVYLKPCDEKPTTTIFKDAISWLDDSNWHLIL